MTVSKNTFPLSQKSYYQRFFPQTTAALIFMEKCILDAQMKKQTIADAREYKMKQRACLESMDLNAPIRKFVIRFS